MKPIAFFIVILAMISFTHRSWSRDYAELDNHVAKIYRTQIGLLSVLHILVVEKNLESQIENIISDLEDSFFILKVAREDLAFCIAMREQLTRVSFGVRDIRNSIKITIADGKLVNFKKVYQQTSYQIQELENIKIKKKIICNEID